MTSHSWGIASPSLSPFHRGSVQAEPGAPREARGFLEGAQTEKGLQLDGSESSYYIVPSSASQISEASQGTPD